MDLLGQASREGAAVAHARERVVLGEELHLLEGGRHRDRRGGLVGEHPQRLQAIGRGDEPVLGLVGPDDADQLARAVVQRDDEPVVVPGQRAGAVARRLVGGALDAEPRARLIAGQQEAALDLELGVEQAPQRPQVAALGGRDLLGRPPHHRARHRALRGVVDELDGDVVEAQRGADAGADLLEDRVDRHRLGQARGDAQQLLERGAVAGRLGRGEGVLDGLGGVGGQRGEDREVVVGRTQARDRLVDGHDPEHVPLAVAQRDEEGVLGMPGVGVVGHLDVGHEGDARVEGPVELVPGQQEAPVGLEVQVEERLPVAPRALATEQRVAALGRAVDGLDAEVVPGRAIERDDDGPVAHGLADRGGDRGQQGVEVLLAAHEPRDLEQTGEPRDGVRAVLGKSHQQV